MKATTALLRSFMTQGGEDGEDFDQRLSLKDLCVRTLEYAAAKEEILSSAAISMKLKTLMKQNLVICEDSDNGARSRKLWSLTPEGEITAKFDLMRDLAIDELRTQTG